VVPPPPVLQRAPQVASAVTESIGRISQHRAEIIILAEFAPAWIYSLSVCFSPRRATPRNATAPDTPQPHTQPLSTIDQSPGNTGAPTQLYTAA